MAFVPRHNTPLIQGTFTTINIYYEYTTDDLVCTVLVVTEVEDGIYENAVQTVLVQTVVDDGLAAIEDLTCVVDVETEVEDWSNIEDLVCTVLVETEATIWIKTGNGFIISGEPTRRAPG